MAIPPVISLCIIALLLFVFSYCLYNRYFHPLSKYPGPPLASITDLWKSYQVLLGTYEHTLLDLHRQHGAFVRIGPNHLDISHPTVHKDVLGAGRSIPKSSFYDAFTALRPNLFGSRDEEVHAARRKATSNSFSMQSVLGMEIYIDRCMELLIARLDRAATEHETIDLKAWIAYFVLDVLGELAFSKSFDFLKTGSESDMPPIKQHVLLAMLTGQTPWILPYVSRFLPYVPFPGLQKMIVGRSNLRQLAITSVNARIASDSQRQDLLGKLLEEFKSGTDNKGRPFDIVDVQTEAFGFIIAGSHTTAASTTLLLWHLLHTPEALSKLVEEIDNVGADNAKEGVFGVSQLTALPYLQACVSEGYRINPVFVMPLLRTIPNGGRAISGQYLPGLTEVSVCNYAFHHDEAVFGPDLESFIPERWLDPNYDKSGSLIAFGGGHRACIGRNIANAEIQKLVSSLLLRYKLELVQQRTAWSTSPHSKVKQDRMPKTTSFGVSELEGPLLVKVHRRSNSL